MSTQCILLLVRSSIDPTFAAYSFVVLCSLNVNYYTAFCGLCHEQGSISG